MYLHSSGNFFHFFFSVFKSLARDLLRPEKELGTTTEILSQKLTLMCGIAHLGKQLLILRHFTNSVVFLVCWYLFCQNSATQFLEHALEICATYAEERALHVFRGLWKMAVKRSLGCCDLWGLTFWTHQCYILLVSLI